MTTNKKNSKPEGVVLQVRLPSDFYARMQRIGEAAGYATISEAAREALRDWTARTAQTFGLQDLMETPAPAPKKAPAKKSRGFSLVEMLFTLALSSVVVVGIFSMFAKGDETARVAQTQQSVSDMANQLRQVYMTRATFQGLNDASAAADIRIEGARDQDNNPLNAWGGKIEFAAMDWGNVNVAASITENAVPVESCAVLAMNSARAFDAVMVNGQQVSGQGVFPTPENTIAACQANGEAAAVSFIIRKI